MASPISANLFSCGYFLVARTINLLPPFTTKEERVEEDWDLLLKCMPEGWKDMAIKSGALKGLRKDKSPENLLRTLLLHIGCGHSLRETVVRARQAGIADLSDVALLKRLRKAKEWLLCMCVALFQERDLDLSNITGIQVRAFDATTVKEPGKTGSLWRIHYSVSIPSLCCDFLKLTETEGERTGESFKHFPVNENDYILGDHGYSVASGIEYIHDRNAYVTVRVNTQSLPLSNLQGEPFKLVKNLKALKKAGSVASWKVSVSQKDGVVVAGRLCAIRKSEEAIRIAHKKLKRRASKKGNELKASTLEFAKYVILFTTFPEEKFSAEAVLEWYRLRWQVELVFKRFKSLAQLGHLPKYDDESSQAWLYGKLLVALLVEKLIAHANFISPWGYFLEKETAGERLA